MVSQDSPSNPTSNSSVHRFIVSDSIPRQTQFDNQQYNAYGHSSRNNSNLYHQSLGSFSSTHPLEERISRSMDIVNQSQTNVADESKISHTRHLMNLLGPTSADTNHQHQQQQRLALSLGSHMFHPSLGHYNQTSFTSDLVTTSYFVSEEQEHRNNDNYTFGTSSTSDLFSRSCSYNAYNGTESYQHAVGSSRYFKATQTLLEEAVSIGGKHVDTSNEELVLKLYHGGRTRGLTLSSELEAELSSNNSLLSAEKHEVQIKFAKLVSLLEEVETRYERYYNQMEEVVSSFEVIAGLGAAKSYTSLALQAISRHFLSLKEAIVSQINVERNKSSKNLPKTNTHGLSQLNMFNKDTSRHDRMSLQQLGLMQSRRQAWRPVRGLPETSVTILRSWLFEHFLHPYPNEYEKLTLASQTCLSKNQVSNWFINARVRLWKPMIEEIWKEEFADCSEDTDPSLACSSSMTKEGVNTDDQEFQFS